MSGFFSAVQIPFRITADVRQVGLVEYGWLALIVGFLLVFAWAIWWSIRRERKWKALKSEQAAIMGFRPIPKPDGRLSKTLLDVFHRHSYEHLELRHVFSRSTVDGVIYWFDVWDPSGDSSTQIAGNAIALVVPQARFPYMTILPYASIPPMAEGEEWAKNLLNRTIKWTAKLSLKPKQIVTFEGVPEFDEHFLVSAPDEHGRSAIQSVLTPQLRSRLSSLHDFALHAGGDVLSIHPVRVGLVTHVESVETLNREISEVSSLFREMCVARDSLKMV